MSDVLVNGDPWLLDYQGCGDMQHPPSALRIQTITPVTALDNQFGTFPKKTVPNELRDILFGEISDDGDSQRQMPGTFAILDSARVPDLSVRLSNSGLEHLCLFHGDDLSQAAPWIVRLAEDNTFTRALFSVGDVPSFMWEYEPGIYLRSESTLEDLCGHFRRFTKLPAKNSGRWHFFRFYTPQVTRTVVAAFDRDQWAVFGKSIRLIACPTGRGGFHVLWPRDMADRGRT